MFCLLAALLLPNISAITQDDKLEVIASYSILADVVHNIAGDRINLTTLIPVGADPHTFQPSPRELTALAEADLIFVNGAGIEEALLAVIESAAEDSPIVEISACVEIIPIGASGHMHEGDDHADDHDDDHAHDEDDDHADDHEDDHAHDEDDDHADDHDDDHAHDEDDDHADDHDDDHAHDEDDDHAHDEDDDHAHDDDDHAHEGEDEHQHGDMESHCDEHDAEFVQIMGDEEAHEHGPVLGRLEDIDCGGGHGHGEDAHGHAHEEGACDPHVWMDPHNVIYWSLMARDILSELDPGHADDYAAAAADYISELVALEAEFILPLVETLPVDKRVLITSHDSLGYLAHAFDFVIVSTVIPGGGTQIEPSARDVAVLIDLVKDAGVAAIFGETTVNTSVVEAIAAETGAELAILYTGTLTEGEPAGTYLDYMRYNLRTIVEALGAGG
ncbi:MAG: zinc ABC transporter substrate-binding protein [Chloroflexi bacterium]|nr:zinc ABC transporter substrate-binding protein [Chloroflexota bacterium]